MKILIPGQNKKETSLSLPCIDTDVLIEDITKANLGLPNVIQRNTFDV